MAPSNQPRDPWNRHQSSIVPTCGSGSTPVNKSQQMVSPNPEAIRSSINRAKVAAMERSLLVAAGGGATGAVGAGEGISYPLNAGGLDTSKLLELAENKRKLALNSTLKKNENSSSNSDNMVCLYL